MLINAYTYSAARKKEPAVVLGDEEDNGGTARLILSRTSLGFLSVGPHISELTRKMKSI